MKKLAGMAAGLVLAGAIGTSIVGAGVAGAAPESEKPAESTIQVNPNPAQPGQEVEITGQCAAPGDIKFVGNAPGVPAPFEHDAEIINPDPNGYVAKAKVREDLGHGAGPVRVVCADDTSAETTLEVHPVG